MQLQPLQKQHHTCRLTWSHWERINLKPHDATSVAAAEWYLISLSTSSEHTQRCRGLSITNLKAESPRVLLGAVGLQVLSSVWKLFFKMLAATSVGSFVPSLGEYEQALFGTELWEKAEKCVDTAVVTHCSSWTSCLPILSISDLSHTDCSYSSAVVLRLASCLSGISVRSLGTGRFDTKGCRGPLLLLNGKVSHSSLNMFVTARMRGQLHKSLSPPL